MIAMKLSWLLMELLLTAFFLYFGSSGALALALVLIVVPLAGIPVNLYLRKHLQVRIAAPVSRRKGEDGEITLLLENPTVFPVFRICCRVKAENQLNRQTQTQRTMTWVLPKKKQSASLHLGSDYCGRIRISLQQAVLYDCFGLIGIRCTGEAMAHMTVQPDIFEMEASLVPVPQSTEDSEVYSQDRPGADLTETFQIREYVPGDSPRQIHWKLSSKFDRLIVRDPALPITRNVLIFWERTGENGNPDLIDAQAETVVSLCGNLLESGIQFTLGWNDTERNICILHEIRDMDELVGVIPRLLRAAGAKDALSGAALLLQTRADALCGHMVYIAEESQREAMQLSSFGHVTMLLCGGNGPDGAILFDEENYRQQLTQIEL